MNSQIRCDSCQKTFSCKLSLKFHIKTIHNDEDRVKCEPCNKSFRTKRNYKYHVASILENNRNH